MDRIAILADSHFHPDGVPTQAAWASDASFNARNAAAVALVRRAAPSLVVHLGDVPHPVPGLPEHERALAVARRTYQALPAPLLVVPGNHDVGDKPHPWAPAPSVSAAKHSTFEATWGRPWWVVEHRGLRLVGLDTPILNSGLPLEAEQWAWLERTLAPGPRTIVFGHYPPFLLDPGEPEHYDNVAEPARGRLLALLRRARVEAVFSGHVHHPFWTRDQGIDYYVVPSSAFVRPEYSELGRVGPAGESGRDDVDRLGFCLLHVGPSGHRVEWVRTGGVTADPDPPPGLGPGESVPDCPLGLTLRHAWDAVLDLPADGLDPFVRKRARNDLVLLAVLDLGIRWLRLPIDDLRDPGTRARLEAVAERGVRVVFWTAGPLTDDDRALLSRGSAWIEALEIAISRPWLDQDPPEVAVPVWVAPFGRAPGEDGAYFSHFAPLGFRPGDPDLPRARADGLVFRFDTDGVEDLPAAIAAARRAAAPRRAIVLVVLPRAGESAASTDDDRVAEWVGRAFHAARAAPDVPVLLDTTVDHDRGYFPRHGLLDRRGNPRRAWWELWTLARSGGSPPRIEPGRGTS